MSNYSSFAGYTRPQLSNSAARFQAIQARYCGYPECPTWLGIGFWLLALFISGWLN